MLHGPHTPSSSCFDKEKKNQIICRHRFPKLFRNETIFTSNGYPEYQRPRNSSHGITYSKKNIREIDVDNSMVVPYNPILLKKYRCHINVEYCASIQSVKYIFDYLHKGGDRAFCKLKKVNGKNNENNNKSEVYDEITQYIDGRYISPMEAAWRLQKFPICGRSHGVINLAVHTENQQKIVFEEKQESKALNKWKTTLTAWLDLNNVDEFAKSIKYVNIPKYYSFNYQTKTWNRRERDLKNFSIGRLNVVSPKDSERFFLKLILNRVPGAKSFVDLRTHNGKIFYSYKEAAISMDLISNDTQILKIFEEAITVMLPSQLRKFFAWFLLYENIQGRYIWDKYKCFFPKIMNLTKKIELY